MIQPNPAKVNFPKITFNIKPLLSNKKYYYNILFSDETINLFYNTKIESINELTININNPYKLKKIHIEKVNTIYIYCSSFKYLNFYLNIIKNFNPSKTEFHLSSDIENYSIIKLPINTNIFINISYKKLNTIFHCDSLILLIDIFEETPDTLNANLKYLNDNYFYFKFKRLIFKYKSYKLEPTKEDEINFNLVIKKILQPYPNIKIYNTIDYCNEWYKKINKD